MTAVRATRRSRTRACTLRPASSSRWWGRPVAVNPRCSMWERALLQPSSGTVSVFGTPLDGINPASGLHVPGRSADAPGAPHSITSRPACRFAAYPKTKHVRRVRNGSSAWASVDLATAIRTSYPGGMRKRVGNGPDPDPRSGHHPDGRAVFRTRYPDASVDGKRVAGVVGRPSAKPCCSSRTISMKRSRSRIAWWCCRRDRERILLANSRSICRVRETWRRFARIHALWSCMRKSGPCCVKRCSRVISSSSPRSSVGRKSPGSCFKRSKKVYRSCGKRCAPIAQIWC